MSIFFSFKDYLDTIIMPMIRKDHSNISNEMSILILGSVGWGITISSSNWKWSSSFRFLGAEFVEGIEKMNNFYSLWLIATENISINSIAAV